MVKDTVIGVRGLPVVVKLTGIVSHVDKKDQRLTQIEKTKQKVPIHVKNFLKN